MTRWLGVGILVIVVVVSVLTGQMMAGSIAAAAGFDGPVATATTAASVTSLGGASIGDVSISGAPSGEDNAADSAPQLEDEADADEAEFDRVRFWIEVFDNGTAQWTFQYERGLKNDSEVERFEEFASEFNANETRLYQDFVRQADNLTENGEDATDREMRAEAFEREARTGGLDDNVGIVEMSFRWVGFAEVDGDRVIIGDVFRGGHMIFSNQSIVVEAGDGLYFEQADPAPDTVSDEALEDSDRLTWDGEREFSDSRPRVVLAPEDQRGENEATPVPTETPAPVPNTPDEGATGDESGPWMAVAFGTVVLLGLAAAAVWQRRDDDGLPLLRTPGPDDGSDGAAAPVEPEPAVREDDLMTDEDRVLTLLEENGGRMKQVNIVKETEWSKSKVSMLLSDMEEEGSISKLRVGRENIISLDGQEPEATSSPLEER